MKRLHRAIIPALFILTAAAAGLRAQEFFPANGIISLPELSTATALSMHLTNASLQAVFADDSGKPLPTKSLMVQWRDGAWRDRNNKIVVQLVFPSAELQGKPDMKIQYKLDYDITYLKANSPVLVKITEYLPTDRAASFNAKADFPLQPVIIDGSGLVYAGAKPGLAGALWTVNSQLGAAAARSQGLLKAKAALKDGTPINKTGAVTANITFLCVGGRKIEWPDNGKDLRKLAPDLVIKLAQPDCQ